MIARAPLLTLLAACWTAEPKPSMPPPRPTPPTPERRAIVRIDAEPSGKRFQGVWLEMPDGTRWVIDYRARGLWASFADAEVIVTGACYEPFGQAILAPHFRVDRIRLVTPMPGHHPILALGPETAMRGTLVTRDHAEGTKLAGAPERFFVVGDTSYVLAGWSFELPAADTALHLTVRPVEPDLAYAAQTGGPNLWLLDEVQGDADPAHAPRPVPCPEPET